MELQKIVWKLYFKNNNRIDPDIFFKIFNTWIPNSSEIFVDVIDYKHLTGGPITLLAGCYADFVYEEYNMQTGLTYAYKKFIAGDNQKRFQQTLLQLISKAIQLQKDPTVAHHKFNLSKLNLLINDRALCKNTSENQEKIKQELSIFFHKKNLNVSQYQFDLKKHNRLQIDIKFVNPFSLQSLFSTL